MIITSSLHKIVVRTKRDAPHIKLFLNCRILYKNQLLLLMGNEINTKLKTREKDGLDGKREMKKLKGNKDKLSHHHT